jgi:dihydroneopterin aldolase
MIVVTFRVDGLALHAHHGVHEAERILGQRFFVDIVVTADVEPALRSDEIGESVHYGHVIKAATLVFTGRTFNLIEAAASAVADDLLDRFPKIVAVSVTVHKPYAPVTAIVADISATIERRRDD